MLELFIHSMYLLFICVLVIEKSHRLRSYARKQLKSPKELHLPIFDRKYIFVFQLAYHLRMIWMHSNASGHLRTWYLRWSPYATNRECQCLSVKFVEKYVSKLWFMLWYNWNVNTNKFNTKKLRRFLTKHKHYKILRSLAKKFGEKFHKLRDRNVKNHWVNCTAKMESHWVNATIF